MLSGTERRFTSNKKGVEYASCLQREGVIEYFPSYASIRTQNEVCLVITPNGAGTEARYRIILYRLREFMLTVYIKDDLRADWCTWA